MDSRVVGLSLGVQHISLGEGRWFLPLASVRPSAVGLEFGRRPLRAMVEFGADYLAGIVLMAVGLAVAAGYD